MMNKGSDFYIYSLIHIYIHTHTHTDAYIPAYICIYIYIYMYRSPICDPYQPLCGARHAVVEASMRWVMPRSRSRRSTGIWSPSNWRPSVTSVLEAPSCKVEEINPFPKLWGKMCFVCKRFGWSSWEVHGLMLPGTGLRLRWGAGGLSLKQYVAASLNRFLFETLGLWRAVLKIDSDR